MSNLTFADFFLPNEDGDESSDFASYYYDDHAQWFKRFFPDYRDSGYYEQEITTDDNNDDIQEVLGLEFQNDDAAWIMACTFIIFTIQTGFGLMESGMCSMKNEVNILIKNVVDVAVGGITFWAFGYGIAMGEGKFSTPFFGADHFFFSPDVNKVGTGEKYLRFFQQVALVSSSTTITSGAMAERCNFHAFLMFCAANVFIYSLPAHWMWSNNGWLRQLGAVDVAGSSVVHALGGVSGLVASYVLGPRVAVHRQRERILLGSAQTSLIGLFMIWWAFLAFNSASIFGVTGQKWMFSAKATVITMISSFGGGCVGLAICYLFYGGKIKVNYIINCVFASLVSITGSSCLVATWEAFLIGVVGALFCSLCMNFLERSALIDDPCAVSAVHGAGGIWGALAVGIFGVPGDCLAGMEQSGIIDGQFYLFCIQCLAISVIVAWSMASTYLLLWLISHLVSLRMTLVEELLGADYAVHNILHSGIGLEDAADVLRKYHEDIEVGLDPTGNNLGHMRYLEEHFGEGRLDDHGDARRRAVSAATLSAIFGERVDGKDVREYEALVRSGGDSSASRQRRRRQRRPRWQRSEGGGAFGFRNVHAHEHVRLHMPSSSEGEGED